MKKAMGALVAAIGLILSVSAPACAGHGYWGGSIWIGPGCRPVYPYPRLYPYPYPYYVGPPAIAERQIIIREPPPVYVEPAPERDRESYWYFCPDPQGYYPYVKKCPKGWLKVVPSPEPEDEEE